VVIQHPAYLLAAVIGSVAYYLLMTGAKGIKTALAVLPLCLLIAAVNPLFNTMGQTVLFALFGRPYTAEALLYGAVVGGIFLVMMLWFGCYNVVLTSDKFTSLFGNLIPSLSLLLVMVLRLIPNFIRKTKQIIGARKSIGKGAAEQSNTKEKLSDGMTVLSSLTDWALEGSVVTGDSMRARGYGTAKRSSFMIYRMKTGDWLLIVSIPILLALIITAACLGQMAAAFTPEIQISPISWGILPYTAYLLIPIALHTKEAFSWHISRLKI
jgi:energy-coupling factor transport system permease protein